MCEYAVNTKTGSNFRTMISGDPSKPAPVLSYGITCQLGIDETSDRWSLSRIVRSLGTGALVPPSVRCYSCGVGARTGADVCAHRMSCPVSFASVASLNILGAVERPFG